MATHYSSGTGGPRVPLTRAIGVAERKKRDSHSHTERERERVRLLQRLSWSGIAQHSFSHSFPLPQLGHRRRLAVSRRVSCACETFSFPDERRCSIIIIIIIVSSSLSSCSEWSERSVANACVRAYHGLPVPVSRPRISPSALSLSPLPGERDMVRCGAVVICAFDAAVHKILVLALVSFVSSYLLS